MPAPVPCDDKSGLDYRLPMLWRMSDFSHVRSHDSSGDPGELIGNPLPNSYLRRTFKTFFEFCLPTSATTVPSGSDWFHEIKYGGYRLRVERDGDRVRLITRGGYDWTKRFPWIVEAALNNRMRRFVIDGEAVILSVDGISDFDALHSGRHNEEVQLCAFDILIEGDDDLRKLPLFMRKVNLERLLARRPEGIFINPFERGEIGPDLFWAACQMGLEGLVSKRRDRPSIG
jgi:bifunctional non-homologous end joining protein LigD